MKRVKNLTNMARKELWENRACPECGSGNYDRVPIQKRIRGCKKPLEGFEYTCRECGCVNQFTER